MPLDPTILPSPPQLSPVPSVDNAHLLHSSPFVQSTPAHTPAGVSATPSIQPQPQDTLDLRIPIQIPLPPTPVPVPVVESYSIDAFTMETPSTGMDMTMTLTPASSVTAISLPSHPHPHSRPSFSHVREHIPRVIQGTERSASVKPEQMHVKKGVETSPEPEYDLLDLSPEELEAFEKVCG